MSLTHVEVQGTLREDGTLVLDHRPGLPPGRVRVLVQTIAPPGPASEDWWQYLQRARKELEAMGYPFLNDEEAIAYIDELRADEDR